MNAPNLLVLIAVILFVLAAFGVGFGPVNFIAAGLAFWAVSTIIRG